MLVKGLPDSKVSSRSNPSGKFEHRIKLECQLNIIPNCIKEQVASFIILLTTPEKTLETFLTFFSFLNFKINFSACQINFSNSFLYFSSNSDCHCDLILLSFFEFLKQMLQRSPQMLLYTVKCTTSLIELDPAFNHLKQLLLHHH